MLYLNNSIWLRHTTKRDLTNNWDNTKTWVISILFVRSFLFILFFYPFKMKYTLYDNIIQHELLQMFAVFVENKKNFLFHRNCWVFVFVRQFLCCTMKIKYIHDDHLTMIIYCHRDKYAGKIWKMLCILCIQPVCRTDNNLKYAHCIISAR